MGSWSWILDFGFWILDFGSWKMCAVWILQKIIATTGRFGSADIRCLTCITFAHVQLTVIKRDNMNGTENFRALPDLH